MLIVDFVVSLQKILVINLLLFTNLVFHFA